MHRRLLTLVLVLFASAACADPEPPAAETEESVTPSPRPDVLDLWERGVPAFGIFVPDERPRGEDGEFEGPDRLFTEEGGARLAQNPLYDYLFLDLEREYDADVVRRISQGLRSAEADERTALLVRIPPLVDAGDEVTRARIEEILDLGADGVVLPHIRDVEEARRAAGFFEDAGADVWSPANPEGTTIAMFMLEDPDAVAQAGPIADLPGYSILACGIGSLTGALGGDREAAEEGTQHVLEEARRAGLPNMITANAENVDQRIQQGFLALLASGPQADEVIEIGRAVSSR